MTEEDERDLAELKRKLMAGEISAESPHPEADRPWTEEEKIKLRGVLGDIFGWNTKNIQSDNSIAQPSSIRNPTMTSASSAVPEIAIHPELVAAQNRLRAIIEKSGSVWSSSNVPALMNLAASMLEQFYQRNEEEAARPPFGLPIEQESKYTTDGYSLINRASGEAIPHDEIVVTFRARDKYLLATLAYYVAHINDPAHQVAMARVIRRVQDWQNANPGMMKEPDTAI